MRYFLSLILVGLIFLSCRKDRTCNCTVIKAGSRETRNQTAGFPPFLPSSDSTTVAPYNFTTVEKRQYDKVSKQQVRSQCASHAEESFNESSSTVTANIFTVTTTETGKITTTCKIE